MDNTIPSTLHEPEWVVIDIIPSPCRIPAAFFTCYEGIMIDPRYMDRALDLAARGRRSVMPNPMVGAVIVHNDMIIGEGYHQAYGGPHAGPGGV